jgi:atypical dual specificity phosphatase
VRRLINLHTTPLPADALARHGLTELHVPVVDFTAPTAEQLRHGVDAIEAGLAAGEPVAVNCGAGLGRTGTLIACYLVSQGLSPDEAIARVRAARPGSVETAEQAAAVAAFARG